MMVTSRELLRIYGEQEYEVLTLPVDESVALPAILAHLCGAAALRILVGIVDRDASPDAQRSRGERFDHLRGRDRRGGRARPLATRCRISDDPAADRRDRRQPPQDEAVARHGRDR